MNFLNGIGPNLFSSLLFCGHRAFSSSSPPPSPPFPRRRPTHFWFIWGLCLKRVKVSQRARSLNFLAEQLSTVLEIPRLVKRKTYAEFLSLKETDLLVVCLLWTKGHAMPNPSIAITSGFFANGSFFFFFHSFRVSIFRDYSLGNIEFSAHWIRFHSSIRIQKVTPIHFHRFSKRSRQSETASGSPRCCPLI